MKIVFLTGNLCNGGAQRVIALICSQLAQNGHDVNLLVFSKSENEYPVNETVKKTYLADSFEHYSKTSLITRLFRIHTYLKKLRPEIGVGFIEAGYALYLASLGLKMKRVASARIDPIYILNRIGLRGKLDKIWFKKADAVILQTETQKKKVENIWKKCVVIPNPVPRETIDAYKTQYSESCQKLIMIGRLTDQKDYQSAICAINRLSKKNDKIKLFIFGKGELEHELRELISKYGLQDVVFLSGWTTETIRELQNSDLFLLTSKYEGMPNALLEAMAIGVPCISTDCETGPKDIIVDGVNGFLVDVGNIDQLANTIAYVMGLSAEERRIIGTEARVYVQEKYGISKVAGMWEKMFIDLLQKK